MAPAISAAESFRKLIAEFRLGKAEADAAPVGDNAPGQADSLEQAAAAGSTTADISDTPAEQPANANSPEVQEINQDPSDGAAPAVATDDSAISSEQPAGAQGPDLLKQAAALEAQAELVFKQACAELAAEVVLRKRAEAVEGAAANLAEQLGIDNESATAIAEGLASGEITEQDLADAAQATQDVQDLSESLQVSPEEIMQAAQEISAMADEKGLSPDDIVQQAVAMHQAEAEQARMEVAKKAYAEAETLFRKASAEKDTFTMAIAKKRMGRILKAAMGEDDEAEAEAETAEQEADEAEKEAGEAEAHAEPDADNAGGPSDNDADNKGSEESAETAATGTDGTDGEEQMAADLMAAGVPQDELQVLDQAVGDLVQGGVPPEIIQQVLTEKMAGGAPDLTKTAEADIMADPRFFAHAYLSTALEDHRARKAGR